MLPRYSSSYSRAFTILELSIVVLILSLLAAAALRYASAVAESRSYARSNESLDVVENALLNYRITYGRLPCPADITIEDETTFGNEIGTLGDGLCTGASFSNSGTDPDNADGLYDATTVSNVVAGAVPVKALKIDNRYAQDAWGRKILYSVDRRMTAASAFLAYPVANTTIGGIVIKNNYNDSLANALTYKAIYALVSFGKNGHGGYVSNPGSSAVRYNNSSTNSDELKNCHCDSSAAATSFDRIFVQKSKTAGSTTLTDSFDDITRFKTRYQVTTPLEMQ